MKKILFILLMLFLTLNISFAFSFDDVIGDTSFDVNRIAGDVSCDWADALSDDNSSIFKSSVKYSFNSSDLIKEYMNDSQYEVQVLADGEPVGPGEKVLFRVNGVDYVRTTDSNGIACLNIRLEPGNYIVFCEYKTFKTYNNIMVI